MRRLTLILLLTLLVCPFGVAFGEEEDGGAQLPFWGINSADFFAEKPRPISIPGAEGVLEHYWYWQYSFRVRTDLEGLKKHYEESIVKLRQNSADDEADIIENNISLLDQTIASIKKMPVYINMYTGDGKLLTDLNSSVVRNLVERETGRKLMTTREISQLDLQTVKESFDPDYGRGKWVHGVAVFNDLGKNVRDFQIRVNGLGKRILPMFLPGRLLYPSSTINMETAFQPVMTRILTFDYCKIGQSADISLTPVEFEGKNSQWVWMWPLQVQVGRYREIEIERASGIKRKYVYAPYFIWNNTHLDQTIEVVKAGFSENIEWGGEKLEAVITDDGTAAGRWKQQVIDSIRERIDNGEEQSFVEENENYPIEYESIDIEAYYRDVLGVEYIPDDPKVVSDVAGLRQTLRSSDLLATMKAELKKLKDADTKRKVKFLPQDPQMRLYRGSIGSGKMVGGVFVLRWGISDLDKLIDDLVTSLQQQALLKSPAEGKQLLQEYLKMVTPSKSSGMVWTVPAPPKRHTVIKMLNDLAIKEIKELGLEVTEDDAQRYGQAAAIGVLLNQKAWAKMKNRAEEKSITDAYLKVRTSSPVSEEAVLVSNFRRLLPAERDALPPIPDEFSQEGTKIGIAQGSQADTVEDKTPVEDEW